MRRLPLRLLALILVTTCAAPAGAAADWRPREPMNAAELQLALQRLTVVGSALYVAAHPDDENTALLAWLVGERGVRTAYLSMTRGDGGQNLIGSETGERLGVIRTQELLAARSLDGAEQFFTRAVDFGYSKAAEETMAIWGREAVLADLVWVIRRFRPDVIVTRFGADGSGGHGHHTASAVLAREAFEAAADPQRFPEQLRWVKPWQAKRVVWNTWRPQLENRDPSRPPLLTVDLGSYNRLLGRAYSEIAGQSRSMHKSQGFGSPERRGSIVNYFEHTAGEPARQDLFDGVTLTWARVPGGEKVGRLLERAAREFRPGAPHESLPLLLEAHAALRALGEEPWAQVKRAELLEVIRSCAGVWMEAVASSPTSVPGGEVKVTTSILNRSPFALTLEGVELPHGARVMAAAVAPSSGPAGAVLASTAPPPSGELRDRELASNQPVNGSAVVRLPAETPFTQPFWLRERPEKGRFRVDDPTMATEPANPPALVARFVLRAGSERLELEAPVVYRWTDRVEGERYRPLEVVPPVTARFEKPAFLFPDRSPRELAVTVRSELGSREGRVRLEMPPGWRAEPAAAAFTLPATGAEAVLRFRVTPAAAGAVESARVSAVVECGGLERSHQLVRLEYPHLPVTTLLPPAEARLVRADLAHAGAQVGYVMGSGDDVPDALGEMGYRVTLLGDEDLDRGNLGRFDAIVVGVRAYNTRPRLRALQPRLLDYVRDGGALIVQYNTNDTTLDNRLGPKPFKISRERVTVEESPVRLAGKHPLLSKPNRIGPADFEGWVQERGLYFASGWDSSAYQTPLACGDPGEKPLEGGLLYAVHGKGVFIYTGYAWFRQLPAGVPGAWRLFANLVSAEP
jgi:LmbE family N-acetylglucosaminyl deacetylase